MRRPATSQSADGRFAPGRVAKDDRSARGPGGIERQVHAAVVKVRRSKGASSTAVHGVYFDNHPRLVLRRYVWPDFLEDEPIAPRRELDALEFASCNGLAAPRVVAADPTGTEIGDGVPALLMTFPPGASRRCPGSARLGGGGGDDSRH